ncbi:helix-turn-helix transcriptional regulator [Rhizobium sp. YIM 134829]|uniref:helix-turn-helix transcriptional regulator n=1 Tax=Rhizobium sp. YIM 134829 TaxID=3390453 RepID=UPI00397C143D
MNIASPITRPCPFTRTEHKIVQLIANGVHTKDAAFMLGLSIHTVNDYVQDAKRKARATGRDHLVAISIRSKWIE